MAGFVYFVSDDRRPVDARRVAELGFGHILDGDASVSSREVLGNSPSGAAGRVFGVEHRLGGPNVGVYPGEQVWRQAPQSDMWVGYWKDEPPTAPQLARVRQLPGPTIELGGDAGRWQVPLVAALDAEAGRYRAALPASWDFDENGNWVRGSVQEEYRRLWDMATPFADKRFELTGREEDVEMTSELLLDTVVALLQANYVVGKVELVMLGALVDDEATALVPLLACDFFTLAEWLQAQKKSDSQPENDGGSTADGATA